MRTNEAINRWITNATGLIGRDEHLPLIDADDLNMTDELVDAWMYGAHDVTAALEEILARDPDNLAARFVALNFCYQLMTLHVPEKEEEVEEQRRVARDQLGFFVRLRDESTCRDIPAIRWEIINACAATDYKRALHLCGQLDELLPPWQFPSDEAYTAGAKIYRKNCAVCHGLPGQDQTAIGKGEFPTPPELFKGEGVTNDRVSVTYWKVANGIQLTGMPGFNRSLSTAEMWQVSLLLANANKLPATVVGVLKEPLVLQ